MRKCKVLVLIPLWRRPEITEICFLGLERLKTHPSYSIQVLCIVSEPDMIPLCEKYGHMWVEAENHPLGRKKNVGLKHAENLDFDFLMELGSDDLVLNELLDDYLHLIPDHDFFGISDIAFLDIYSLEARRYTNQAAMYGAGRMIKRWVLERANFKIWDDKGSRLMDGTSAERLRGIAKYRQMYPRTRPQVMDIKSDQNIWEYNAFLGMEYNANEFFERISSEEVEAIKCYHQKLTSASATAY